MIRGVVSADRQAIIDLAVRGFDGQSHDYPATIDTGFSGFLTLADDVITRLGLPYIESRFYTLGDGRDIEMRLYRAIVVWDRLDRVVLAVEADGDALIGMEMLSDQILYVDVHDNGEVRIEQRP